MFNPIGCSGRIYARDLIAPFFSSLLAVNSHSQLLRAGYRAITTGHGNVLALEPRNGHACIGLDGGKMAP